MFSFLVAIALYLTLLPGHPSLSAAELPRPLEERLLPIAPQRAPERHAPRKKDESRLGIETAARASIAVDWESGTVLSAKNAYEPMPIASITKLMTALVAAERTPEWDREVSILPEDARSGAAPTIHPGERVLVRDLFAVSLVASGNDAAAALARSTGLSAAEFVARMNALASEIGMVQATFVEPTGLHSGNRATAHDVAALLRRALDVSEIRDAVQRPRHTFTATSAAGVEVARTVISTNELLGGFLDRPPYAFLGGKTGYLPEAGYCFAAAAQDADGNRVVSVVLGAPERTDRFVEAKNLLFWAFDAYEWPPVR